MGWPFRVLFINTSTTIASNSGIPALVTGIMADIVVPLHLPIHSNACLCTSHSL